MPYCSLSAYAICRTDIPSGTIVSGTDIAHGTVVCTRAVSRIGHHAVVRTVLVGPLWREVLWVLPTSLLRAVLLSYGLSVLVLYWSYALSGMVRVWS